MEELTMQPHLQSVEGIVPSRDQTETL